MFTIYDKEKQKIPICVWLNDVSDIEKGCLEQAINLSNHPCVCGHVSLMPDCHQGYGMPIGGVIACKDVVIPNAVGVDIGCGMSYVKTDVDASMLDRDLLREMLNVISEQIPTGFKHHNERQKWDGWELAPTGIPVIDSQINKAKYQLGTLGGGNHFIEIQRVETGKHKGKMAIMIHSGSRNFGYQIAKVYNDLAIELNNKWKSGIDQKWGLNFLPVDSEEGMEYISAMTFALNFAAANRYFMMKKIKDIVFDLVEKRTGKVSTSIINEIDTHHNYVSLENHFRENLWVHRKGAIRMRKNMLGVIPGSQGAASYIVKGKGETNSFQSASHGAGRKMGRCEATRTLELEQANKSMGGIVCERFKKLTRGSLSGMYDLGEAPAAYKDIDTVIKNEGDLVAIVEKVKQLMVVKG